MCYFTTRVYGDYQWKALDSFHIKLLPRIAGVQYWAKMENEKFYEVAKTRPLTIDIMKFIHLFSLLFQRRGFVQSYG